MSTHTESGSPVSLQTSPQSVSSTPQWFGEVAVVAHDLRRLGMLSDITERVRFARRRFGHYDRIDFAVVLVGYAISGEHTLEAFYERLQPFAHPFMALFGRERLPQRSTLSRFLAALSQAPVEILRAVFLEDLLARPAVERGKNRRAVGPARNEVGGLRCRWHATSRPATSFANYPQSPADTTPIGQDLRSRLYRAQAG
jgi:hypothetical protein